MVNENAHRKPFESMIVMTGPLFLKQVLFAVKIFLSLLSGKEFMDTLHPVLLYVYTVILSEIIR